MSILNQKTLNKRFTFKGIGLHTGKISTVNILQNSKIFRKKLKTFIETSLPSTGERYLHFLIELHNQL